MGKTNFTKQYITGLLPPETGRLSVYDTKVRGLGILVQRSGYKAFFWFKKIRGYPYWKSLGRFPELSVENARTAAEDLNVKLANWKARNFEGENPFTKQRAPTVGALIDLYIENRLKTHSTNPDKAVREAKRGKVLYFARWNPKKLGSVTRKEIQEWHAEVGRKHGPVTANRSWEFFRTIFNWAIKRDLWNGKNPATLQKGDKFPENERERFLQEEEMPAFLTTLRNETNVDLRDFIVLALFTEARKGDILAMRWDQISGKLWTVPNKKKPRHPYVVGPLVDEVLTVLKERKKRTGDSLWVFPSKKSKVGHLTTVKRSWREFVKHTKLKNLTIHDMRRTGPSWQAMAGVSLPLIGAGLGHRDPRSTARYARLQTGAAGQIVKQSVQALLAAGEAEPEK
jgi:integrase